MAGFKSDNDDDLIGDINVTPFVDVALVMLVIFMATSAVIARTALDLEIPVAANSEEKEGPPILSVVLNEDESVALNGEPIDRPALENALRRQVQENQSARNDKGKPDPVETQVLISARGEHPYQKVVDLIDLVKGTGVNAIALNTKVPPKEELAAAQ